MKGFRTWCHWEEVARWTCPENGENLLVLAGKFPKLHSFACQAAVLATLAGRFIKNKRLRKKGVRMRERDLSSAWHIFIRARREEGMLDVSEVFVLRTIYEACVSMQREVEEPVGAVIVFMPGFLVTLSRLRQRQQTGDSEINVEYLRRVYDLYETYITEEPERGRELAVIRSPMDGPDVADVLGEVWMYISEREKAKGDWSIRSDQARYKHSKHRCH